MASRYRSCTKTAFSFVKASGKPKPPSSFSATLRPQSTLRRSPSELRSLQTLIPFYSAVSAARLTSCLGMDSRSSRCMSQVSGMSVPR